MRLIREFSAPDEEVVRKAWEYAKCPIESLWPAVVFGEKRFSRPRSRCKEEKRGVSGSRKR